MASSAQNKHLHGGATSAPPPTPSAQPNSLLSTAAAADTLSHLLLRLPPSLCLPTTRRRASAASPATCHPLVSLSDDTLLSSSHYHQLGFFQLTDHSVPSRLADSAESEALSLFNLSPDKKQSYFPKNWPLGYHGREEDDGGGESFCLDSACSAESPELSLPSLSELTRELERVGLRILGLLSGSLGFENPDKLCTLTWLSDDVLPGKEEPDSAGFYPYVVGLQYQTRTRKCSLLGDSGWVSVSPQVDSVLVTIGDIAQVWSNGKLKKVRGKPIACSLEEYQGTNKNNNNSPNISMTVLITLPLDATVSPLLPRLETHMNHEPGLALINEEEEEEEEEEESSGETIQREKRLFNSFSFEDYAWRVYHERLTLKDPLDRYRVKM